MIDKEAKKEFLSSCRLKKSKPFNRKEEEDEPNK
ncbi:hypothetical protein C7M17_03361 [Bacillus subtilis]|nr:hypothetical protein C7M17_03361 [Bacillus subtilis]